VPKKLPWPKHGPVKLINATAAMGHQVLGGIGYTMDGDMHLYFRRAKSGELTLGDG